MRFLIWRNVNVMFLIFGVIIMLVIMTATGIYFGKIQDKQLLNYKFNGRVDSVWYSSNSNDLHNVTEPFVIIKGKKFHLFYHSWDFGNEIQKGDSLIKKDNTFIVTLIKRNGKMYVYGKN